MTLVGANSRATAVYFWNSFLARPWMLDTQLSARASAVEQELHVCEPRPKPSHFPPPIDISNLLSTVVSRHLTALLIDSAPLLSTPQTLQRSIAPKQGILPHLPHSGSYSPPPTRRNGPPNPLQRRGSAPLQPRTHLPRGPQGAARGLLMPPDPAPGLPQRLPRRAAGADHSGRCDRGGTSHTLPSHPAQQHAPLTRLP
jgi:hypothetical protein